MAGDRAWTSMSETELILRAQAGAGPAWVELLSRQEPRIRFTARNYLWCGASLDDLVQAGRIGFVEGVTRFDPHRGNTLWTYARRWVQAYLNEELCRWLGVTDYERRRLKDIHVARQELRQRLAREPTVEEIAVHLSQHTSSSIAPERIQALLALSWPGADPALAQSYLTTDQHTYHSPEEALLVTVTHEEHFNAVLEILGSPAGVKWLVLFALTELHHRSHAWVEIITVLVQPSSELIHDWPDTCLDHHLPEEIPRDWEQVSRLFQVPPPAINSAPGLEEDKGLNQAVNRVKQWYRRQKNALRRQFEQG